MSRDRQKEAENSNVDSEDTEYREEMLRSQIPKESGCNRKQRGNVRITRFQRIAINYPATRTAGNYLDQRLRPRWPESELDSGGVL